MRVTRRLFAALWSGALGLLVLVAGAIHTVSVVHVAYANRGGYDVRAGTLVVVGVAAMSSGLLLLMGAWGMHRGRRAAKVHALFGAGMMFATSAALSTVIEGFWEGLVLYGSFLAFAPLWTRWAGEGLGGSAPGPVAP